MKKLILLSFVLALMCSCGETKEERQVKNSNYQSSDSVIAPDVTRLSVVVYDSCEYIQCYTYAGNYVITHKGNCKYCAERARQANLIKISL